MNPAQDPAVENARRNYRFISAAEYVRRLVDTAPPLTPVERAELALLLRSDGGPDVAA
ncbi:MAG: hypothetical protein M3353_07210 [Actinomycetota bacterium]|nr:hypothetical protein [Actinomycetota bacterium]